jgi:hypothetical protein
MADAVQRASGVSMAADQSGVLTKAVIRGMDTKYSYTSVNGFSLPSPDDRSRYLALNLLPANIIDRLEVYKTLTPAMPGNAIGGLMNIVTPEVPSKQQFSVRLATGYSQTFFQRPFLSFNSKVVQQQSPYEKYGANYYAKGSDFTKDNVSFQQTHPRPDMQANVFWGKKFLQGKVGAVVNLGAQNIKEGYGSFFIVQNNEPQLNNVPGITDFTKREYSINSDRRNAYARIDYSPNSKNHFQVSELYTWKRDIESRDWVDTSLAEGRTGYGTGRIAFSQRSRVHDQSLQHINVQGSHQVKDMFFFDWAAIYANAKGSYPDWAEYGANTGRILGANGAITQTPVLLAPMNRIWMHNSEKEKAASANFTYARKNNPHQLQLKTGALLQFRNRDNFYNQYFFNPAFTQANGQPFTDVYHAIWYNDNGPQNPLGSTNTPGTYTATENISAFFGEIDFKVKKMEFVAGVRNELTKQTVTSSVPPTDNLGKEVKISYSDWLPSLHMRYVLNEKESVRFSYYKALSRPALYDITFFNMNYDDYNVAGNPFLKHSTANNFDLRYELYNLRILNELQVTAFYKQVTNPYEKTLLNANDTLYPVVNGGSSYTAATKITEQLRNFGSAYLYGADISLVKNFGNLSIAGNYTFTSSHIVQSKKYKQRENPQDGASDIVTTTRLQNRPLQGQSDHIASMNVSYRIPRWDCAIQVTGVYTGKRIENVSGWYNMDNWQKAYTTLNLSIEKTVAHHFRFFARAGNLLNAQPVVYINTAPVDGIPEQTAKGKLIIEKTHTYAQYVMGVEFKL